MDHLDSSGVFLLCDAVTIGRSRPSVSRLPGGACAHGGDELPSSRRERRPGHAGSVRSRSGRGRDRGLRGSGPGRAGFPDRRRPIRRASGSSRPNGCRGAGSSRGGRRTAPRAGCRSACRSRTSRGSDARRTSHAGRRPDRADERERVGPSEQPRRQRLGRAGERRCGDGDRRGNGDGRRNGAQRRPPPSISRSRRSIRRRYRPLTRRPRRRRPSRPRPSPRHPRTDGVGTGNGIAVTQSRKYRSHRRSGRRTGSGTGIGIAGLQIHCR